MPMKSAPQNRLTEMKSGKLILHANVATGEVPHFC